MEQIQGERPTLLAVGEPAPKVAKEFPLPTQSVPSEWQPVAKAIAARMTQDEGLPTDWEWRVRCLVAEELLRLLPELAKAAAGTSTAGLAAVFRQ